MELFRLLFGVGDVYYCTSSLLFPSVNQISEKNGGLGRRRS
jgi:hypothetical protein